MLYTIEVVGNLELSEGDRAGVGDDRCSVAAPRLNADLLLTSPTPGFVRSLVHAGVLDVCAIETGGVIIGMRIRL